MIDYICVCVCARVCVHTLAQLLSHAWLFVTPMDCSPSGSSVHGISQVRILEKVAISSSRGPSQPRDWILVSCVLHCQADSFIAPSEKPIDYINLSYLNLTTLCSRHHFTDEDTEAQRDWVISPEPHSWYSPEPRFDPSRLDSNLKASALLYDINSAGLRGL